jgi:DNA-binding MarR family transcriptional regulator
MDDADPSVVADCSFAWQILRMAHDRVAKRLASELSDACGLAINEFDVLLYLHRHAQDGIRISALLEAVPLSQPALSRLVARLEARGLLARSAVETDGRARVVCLTDAGVALIERAIGIHAQVVQEALSGKFSDTERTVLLRTLSQIGQ